MTPSLAQLFVSRCGAAAPTAEALTRLGEALERQLAAAAAEWPTVKVPDEEVVTLWATRVARAARDLPAEVDRLRAADLYIACGCGRADPAALQAFEARYFTGVGTVVARVARSAEEVQEVVQILREKLFVPRPDGRAAIVEMTGFGELGGLIRVAALRVALNHSRAQTRQGRADDLAELDALAPLHDPELAAIREEHRALLKRALEQAIVGLPPRDRTVLRMQLLDALTIDDIARAHDVHRATAARWLERIRADLRAATVRGLRAALGASQAELDSLVGVADSRLSISFDRLLRSTASP